MHQARPRNHGARRGGRAGQTRGRLGPDRARRRGHVKALHESIPPALADEFAAALESAGKSIELYRYDAVHAFANPSNAKYDQAAAADAWAHVREFLAKHLA